MGAGAVFCSREVGRALHLQLLSIAAPSFNGKDESLSGHAMQVDSRRQVTPLEVREWAPATVLLTETKAGDACVVMGADELPDVNGVAAMLVTLEDYYAPDALNVAYQYVSQFPNFKKSALTTDEYPAEFDLLRCETGRQIQQGRSCLGTPTATSSTPKLPPRLTIRRRWCFPAHMVLRQ